MSDEIPPNLPDGYTLDLAGDPCVIVLLREDGTLVARFTRNVDPREVRRAAEEDSAAAGGRSWALSPGAGGPQAAMSVVVQPSARETFTPRELTDAYERFKEHGPQYLSEETGQRASAYRFGERVLLVYEEAQTGLVVLIHPIAWKGNSAISGYLKRVPQTRTSKTRYLFACLDLYAPPQHVSPPPSVVVRLRSHPRALERAIYARSCKRTSENTPSKHSGE